MKALLTFKKYRPNNQRLEPNEDIYLELELRPRSDPNEYEKKKTGLKPASAKDPDSGNRIVGLFVPVDSQTVLEDIIKDYQEFEPGGASQNLSGLDEKKKNPPRKSFVEAIEDIRQARLETFWLDDLEALPQAPMTSFGGRFGAKIQPKRNLTI